MPFIENHNRLRSEFHSFENKGWSREEGPKAIRSSLGLIQRIAIEPLIARYIIHADLSQDSLHLFDELSEILPDLCYGPMAKLFLESSYLRQAGLDWREYCSLIAEEIQQGSHNYSQHAASFLLTLLPNVKTLILPTCWKTLENPDKLIHVVVGKSREPAFQYVYDRPSLAQITHFETSNLRNIGRKSYLNKGITFLDLPHIQSFQSSNSIAVGGYLSQPIGILPYLGYSETLERLHLENCFIDKRTISSFLKHTPFLRELKYSHEVMHSTGGHEWKVLEFIGAIAREVGGYLEKLSVTIDYTSPVNSMMKDAFKASVSIRKPSIGGFQNLQMLEIPLDIFVCHFSHFADTWYKFDTLIEGNHGLKVEEANRFHLWIGNLVPKSVSHLSLISNQTSQCSTALKAVFYGLASAKKYQLPALQKICISAPIPILMSRKMIAELNADAEMAGLDLKWVPRDLRQLTSLFL